MGFILLKDILANLAIFTSAIVLIHAFFGNRENFESVHDVNQHRLQLRTKISIGIVEGIVGTIILFYGLRLGSGALIDLRHLSIVISSLFGGLPSALITGIMIAGSRIFWVGNMGFSDIVGAVHSINMAIGCGLISMIVSLRNKWGYLNLYCLLSITLASFILIKSTSELVLVLSTFWIIGIISAYWIYYIMNRQFRESYYQQAIKDSEERFRLITENMYDVVTVLDTKGVALYNSPSSKQIGIDPIKYVGRCFFDFVHPEDVKRVRDSIRAIVRRKSKVEVDYRWKHPNGHWIDIDLRGTPVIEKGGVTKIVVVSRNITKQKELEKRLKYLSSIDSLTGVANRRFFDETLLKEWDTSVKESSTLSLILFDIDYFKLFNDIYGHQKGDTCLRNITESLLEITRGKNKLARYGGEEFVVILPEVDAREARRYGEEMRAKVESLQIKHEGSPEYKVVTISVGIATTNLSKIYNPQELIESADKALYEAKRDGRNCVRNFN